MDSNKPEDRKTTTAAAAARNVVSLLAGYIEAGEKIPNDLVLVLGGCLIEHIDEYGDDADPDIKRLYDACSDRMSKMNENETIDTR